MDAPTDYTSAWHFRDSLERQHFSRQVAAYLTVLADRFASLAERAKSEELPPHTIIGQYEEAHLSFRMRFWILESIADLVRRGELPLSEGVVHVQHAIAAALCLFSQRSEPTLLRLQASRKKVCQGFPGRDHQIAIAYDPEPPDLSVADDYGWWRRFYDAERGPVVGVRWDQIETAADPVPKAAAAVAAKSSARAQVPTIRLTRSQQRCAEVLRSYWLALHEASTAGGYGQRPPLIAAQSGSGKTRLVRWMAESMHVPLLILDVSSWLLTGSRSEKPTLAVLQEWHQQHDRGILLIDELDKMNGNDGGWWQGARLELMSYLDGRVNWPPDLLTKVRTKFLTIGAGTWQGVFSASNRSLGFGQQESDEGITRAIEADFGAHDRSIPQELGFRFDPPLLLHLPSGEEFAERIKAIRTEVGWSALNPPALAALVEEAKTSNRGQRWLESYSSRMLRARILADERDEYIDF